MSDGTIYALADGISFESVSDGSVVLVFGSGQLYSCNATSTAFLSALDGRRTISDVAAAMAEEFDAEPATIAADVRALAAEMLSEGIIVSVP